MKLLIVFSAIVAAAVARPGYLAGGVASIAAAPAVVANAPDAAAIADAVSRVAVAAPAAVPAVAPAPAVVADAPAVVAAPAPSVVAAAPAVISAPAPAVVAAAPAVVAAPAPGVLAAAPAVIAAAAPAVVAAPLTITTQYHAQDELGQYAYGYAGGPSAKEEIHTADGITRGGYSHIDANGLVQTTSYVSDPVNGFRVAATNLPVAPRAEDAAALGAPQQVDEEPLVAATRAAHEALKAELAAAAEAAPDDPEPIEIVQAAPAAVKIAAAAPIVLTAAGVPVDTPEVAAAKAADVIAHIEAKKAALSL